MPDDPDQLPDAKGLSDLAAAIVDEQLDPARLEKQEKHARNVAISQEKEHDKYAIETAAEWFLEEAARRIIAATDLPESLLDPLARGAIESLLKPGEGGRAGTTNAGGRLIAKLSGDATTVSPGIDGAARYLTLFINESVEAWLRGVIVEFVTEYMPKIAGIGGGIETVQHLQEIIEHALGGARMVRRVIQPFVSATAITPAQWFVNKKFRPELLGIPDACRQHLRGRMSREQLDEELGRQGWSAERIDSLLNGQRKFFTPAQVNQFVTRGHWEQQRGLQHLLDQGYDQTTAEDAGRLEGLTRVEQLEAQEANAIVTLYANREISDAEFHALLDLAVQNVTERHFVEELGTLRRRLNVRFLSSAEERRLVQAGIRSAPDYRRALEREGYQPDAVAALDLELRAIMADKRADEELKAQQKTEKAREDAEAAAARAARLAALAAEKALPSVAEIRQAYIRGHLPIDRYARAVQDAHPGIAGEDLAALAAEAEADRAAYLATLDRRAKAEADQANAVIPLGALETAVRKGVLTIEDYARELKDRGYDIPEINVLAGVLRAELEDAAAAAAKRAEAEKRAAAKGVSLNAWERAVRLGVRTLDQYDLYLSSIETPELARVLIVDVLRKQLALDDEARAKRAASEAAAATRGISLERRRRAVILGIRDLADHERALTEARLPIEDQRLELELAQAEIAEAAAARARRDEIAAEQAAREQRQAEERAAKEAAGETVSPPTELTLSQVERAVKLGLLDPEELRVFALARGYAPEDADLLLELATYAIPDLRDGAARRQVIAAELAAKRVSLADLENAVLRGIRTLPAFEADLAGRGYGEDDVALLSQLLAERVALDVDRLRTKIRAALEKAEAAPPLEEFDAAIAAGSLTPADAIAFLEGAGIAHDTALVYVRLLLTLGVEA